MLRPSGAAAPAPATADAQLVAGTWEIAVGEQRQRGDHVESIGTVGHGLCGARSDGLRTLGPEREPDGCHDAHGSPPELRPCRCDERGEHHDGSAPEHARPLRQPLHVGDQRRRPHQGGLE